MIKNKIKGFTLVELLAVIVILAIILVIAVPKVMSVIEDSKKATLESTAKMIASAAEKVKVQNKVLGKTDAITCESVAKINDLDYDTCSIDFEDNTAKVTIKGSGKFAGFYVCNGKKTDAVATEESCGLRTLTVNLDGGADTVDYNAKYEAGSEVTLTAPTKEGYAFSGWIVSGEGASVEGNVLIMGSDVTTVTATWEVPAYGAALTIKEMLKNESTLNNGLVQTYATIDGKQVDTGIRYVGPLTGDNAVKNKVYFNCKDIDLNDVSYGEDNYDYDNSCEIWRIIGVFDTKSSISDTKGRPRIKLVRDEFVDINGNSVRMSWDSSYSSEYNGANSGWGINQWGESVYQDGTIYDGADLMQLLNGYYIGKENSTCSYCDNIVQGICQNDCSDSIEPLSNTSLDMITNAVWNLGANHASTLTDMYVAERGNQTGKQCSGSSCTDKVIRTTEWVGKIGLIYPSDYAYASADESCASKINKNDSTCKNNNWLYPTYGYWTIKPTTGAASVYYVYQALNVDSTHAYNTWGVRPSLYLSHDVEIIGGNGDTEPYILK